MTTFTINITIDSDSVKKIWNASQYVTLVKSVGSFVESEAGSACAALSAVVAWQVFQPFESNVVTWIESYNLYATTTSLDINDAIVLNSTTSSPAVPGWTYAFAKGQLTATSTAAQGSAFYVSNQTSSGNFSFGLAQVATVNGTPSQWAALNAAPALYNETAQFLPAETISIFLSSCSQNGTVIPGVADDALVITLSGTSPTADVGFNDNTDTFYLSS